MQGRASINIQQFQKNKKVKLLMMLVCLMGVVSSLIFLYILTSFHVQVKTEKIFKIAATSSFKPYQPEVEKLAKENKLKVKVQYLDSVSLAEAFKQNKLKVDAIWSDSKLFNSVFNINRIMTEDSLLFYSPVTAAFKRGIEKQYIKRGLGLNSTEFFEGLKNGKIKVAMPIIAQSPEGQAFYAGIYRLFVGEKFDVSRDSLNKLKEILAKAKLSFVSDENELEKQLLGNEYDVVITSEHVLAMFNSRLREEKQKSPRIGAYFQEAPRAISANFGFIKKNKEKRAFFRQIQSFVVSKDGQQLARDNGYRSVYSGTYKNSIWAGLLPVGSASKELKLSDSELQTIFSYYQSNVRTPSKVNIVLNLEKNVGGSNAKIQTDLKKRLVEISANNKSRFFLAPTRKDEFKFVLSKSDPEKINLIDFKDSSSFGDEFRSLQSLKAPNKTDLSTALTKAISDLCDEEEAPGRRSVILISDTDELDSQMRSIQLLVRGCRKKVDFYVVYIGDKKNNKRIISDYSVEKILHPKETMYITKDNVREMFWKLRGLL